MLMINIKKNKIENRGFTLIELMVSISIFAIVLVMSMGAILTVVDANRKARTLSEVMNNVTFIFESITRTIKTGSNPTKVGSSLRIEGIPPVSNGDFSRVPIYYRRGQASDGRGYIERCVEISGVSCLNSSSYKKITAPEVDVKRFNFYIRGTSSGLQPKINMQIQGTAKASEKIQSDFSIQTTISQRNLRIN